MKKILLILLLLFVFVPSVLSWGATRTITGQEISISVDITETIGYIIRETIPSGMTVTSTTANGVIGSGFVKWIKSDSSTTLLSYTTTGIGTISGKMTAGDPASEKQITGASSVTTCTPTCDGKECGPDDCGGSCGTCATGSTCNANGACAASCTNECNANQKRCSSDLVYLESCVLSNGCYIWSKTKCTTGACNPDGNGGTAACGTCVSSLEICDGKDNDCDSSVDEGGICNSETNCGTFGTACSSGQICENGACITSAPTCTPACDGKTCGDDGCDGSCGTCSNSYTCTEGTCVENPPETQSLGDQIDAEVGDNHTPSLSLFARIAYIIRVWFS